MTLAAITMTAPEAASPVQMYRATYSPDDNKLRLYAVSRLDPETYKKVHDAGFRWAPKTGFDIRAYRDAADQRAETVRRWPLCPGRAVQPGSVSGWLNWS
ncbi:TPA: hypothetical protein JLS19_004021 [Escherichia coli]|nr:hypothetical protein [Escherichia coli]HAW3260766.1 hypothetical protein [Escherichia coli]